MSGDIEHIGELVLDPVCGRAVWTGEAHRVVGRGVREHFCSIRCRTSYLRRVRRGESVAVTVDVFLSSFAASASPED
jgi:YHS domain-containing protein